MAYYISELYDFLGQLSVNNERNWFKSHKDVYDRLRELWLEDLGRLIGDMSEWEPSLRHLDPRRAAYRIYRDTRFSADKTPYKTYFSASMAPGAEQGAHHVGYYLQIGINDDGLTGLYAGIWCPEAPVLNKLRHAIVDNIEEWEAIMNEPTLRNSFQVVTTGSLKTAPKGWPKDHPQIEWLRMRDFGLEAPVGSQFFLDNDWPQKTSQLFRLTKPMIDFLDYSINE